MRCFAPIVSQSTNCLGQRHGGMACQLHLSAAFHRVSLCGLLYRMRSIGVGRQFLSIVSEFLGDRRQGVRLDGSQCVS